MICSYFGSLHYKYTSAYNQAYFLYFPTFIINRQQNMETGAYSLLTGGINNGLVAMDNFPAQGQPQPRSFIFVLSVEPGEYMKDPIGMLLVKTNSVVFDSNVMITAGVRYVDHITEF